MFASIVKQITEIDSLISVKLTQIVQDSNKLTREKKEELTLHIKSLDEKLDKMKILIHDNFFIPEQKSILPAIFQVSDAQEEEIELFDDKQIELKQAKEDYLNKYMFRIQHSEDDSQVEYFYVDSIEYSNFEMKIFAYLYNPEGVRFRFELNNLRTEFDFVKKKELNKVKKLFKDVVSEEAV